MAVSNLCDGAARIRHRRICFAVWPAVHERFLLRESGVATEITEINYQGNGVV